MFENIISFFKKLGKKDTLEDKSKNTAKERLQLVLMQDRANVSADFLDMMRKEIIEVIKKYIDVDESQIDVKLTNKTNEDGTMGAPALYANIPIAGIKENVKKNETASNDKEDSKEIKEDKEAVQEDSNKDNKEKEESKEENSEEKDLDEKSSKEEDTQENKETEDKSKIAENEEPEQNDEKVKEDKKEEPKED